MPRIYIKKTRGFSISVLQVVVHHCIPPSRVLFVPLIHLLTLSPPKMKLIGLAFLGTIAASTAQVVIVPTGPVKGPNTLVFKEIGGVPNNECLTFTNQVCPVPSLTSPPPLSSPNAVTNIKNREISSTPLAHGRTPTARLPQARFSAPTCSSSNDHGCSLSGLI